MMLQSESVSAIATALVKVQTELPDASKTKKGQSGKAIFKYADLGAVIDASRPLLTKHGVAVLQRALSAENGIRLQTILVHAESGEWISDAGLFLPASRGDAQGYGSALTYARRYGLAAMLGIVQEDDDAQRAAQAPKRAAQDLATDAQKAELKASIEALPEAARQQLRERFQAERITWGTLTPAQLVLAQDAVSKAATMSELEAMTQ